MKYLIYFLRLAVGGFFIFSGFVKAVDPMGTGFKMEEYFEVFTGYLPFLNPLWELCASYALPISIAMIVFELVLGLALILGIPRKLTLWGYALLIGFFTLLTGFSAYTGKVTDCGCFGDFLKLKPIETFTKDIVLSVLVILLVLGRKHIVPFLNKKLSWALLLLFTVASLGFTMRNYYDLPILDFRPYKNGANLCEGKKTEGLDPGEVLVYYTLENKNTKESKEVESKQYMTQRLWEDAAWEINKDKTRKIVVREPQAPKIKDFAIIADGHDIADAMLAREGYQLIVSSYNFDEANQEGFKRIAAFARQAAEDNVSALGVTNADLSKVESATEGVYKFYTLDATPIKTMMRSNPGITLIKNCIVIDKWHHNHLPAWKDVKAKYNINKQNPQPPLDLAPTDSTATMQVDTTAVK